MWTSRRSMLGLRARGLTQSFPMRRLVSPVSSSPVSSSPVSSSPVSSSPPFLLVPRFTRLNDLAKLFKTSVNKITKELKLLKNKKRFYLKHENIWFEFNSTSEVIIPSSTVKNLAIAMHKSIVCVEEEDMLSFDNEMNSCDIQRQVIPVVALLGHFNHGKTTLLDALRGTRLVDEEAHQITQVVRSRAVALQDASTAPSSSALFCEHEVTIIDTPGQEIFYRMRNYGAAVADIGVLVVACDDGVCTQTQECIGILEQLKVPIIVALNKIDHPDATESRVESLVKDLREYLVLEDVPIVPLSALNGENIGQLKDNLMQFISTSNKLSETNTESKLTTVKDTEANISTEAEKSGGGALFGYKASGTLTNQWSSQKDGQVFHVILRKGTLNPGDWFSAGGLVGTIVSIVRDDEVVGTARAGMGLKLRITIKAKQEPSPLGDVIYFFSSEIPARKLADFRYMESKFPAFALPPGDVGYAARLDMQWLHNFAGRVEAEKFKDEWNNADGNVDNVQSDDDVDTESMEGVAVVKSDTSLSMCTFIDNLEELREHRYDSDADQLETSSLSPLRRIVRNGVGDITPTDVLVAHTAKAPILAYEVGILPEAARQAENQGVKVYYFDKMEDVVSILGGADLSSFQVLKPKRRHKNSI